MTLEAVAAVRQAVLDGKPFFLYFAQFAPHAPIMPDPRFVQRYLDAGLPEVEAVYPSMIERVNDSLGDLMDLLEEPGTEQFTAVFFASDNGGLSLPGRGTGVPSGHNAPLNSGKDSTCEGGIRVPLVVRWPGLTAPGSVMATPVTIKDFFRRSSRSPESISAARAAC